MRLALPIALLLVRMSFAASDPGKPRPPYRITGVAVSSRDGSPIPFCRILVAAAPEGNQNLNVPPSRLGGFPPPEGAANGFRGRWPEAPGGQDEAVLADARGRFSIDVPKAGAWQLSGIARGYRLQGFDVHETFSSAVVVSDAAPTASVRFRLAPNAEISGVVFDEAGEPVAGAQLQAILSDGPSPRPAGFAQTDDRGHYAMASLAPGTYRLRVEARPWYAAGGGSSLIGRFATQLASQPAAQQASSSSALDPSLDVVYPVTWYPGTDDLQAAEVLTLSGGEDRQADFHLLAEPAARLAVPRTGAESVESERRGVGGPVVTRVAEEGTVDFPARAGVLSATGNAWEVSGLAPGTYEVRMPAGGGEDEVRRLTVRSGGAVDLASGQVLVRVGIQFEGDAADRPQVVLTDSASGARFVTGGGRPGLQDFGRRRDAGGAGTAAISVPPGSYRVSVVGPGDTYLAGVTTSGAGTSEETVRVTGGSPVMTLRMAAGRAQLRGVARQGEAPSAGAMVLLVPASADVAALASRTARTETNTDGSFVLAGLVPGPYILVVLDGGWGVNWRDASTLAGYLIHGKPIDLKPAGRQQVEIEAVRP